MHTGLLKLEVKSVLEDLVGYCFYANRMIDRMCSILSVPFVMTQTSNIIHHKLSHLYPLLADDITDYMDGRGCITSYPETIAGNQDYADYIEIFNEMLSINLEFEKSIVKGIVIAEASNDYSTKVFLENFLLKVINITKDIMMLVDKADKYGDSNSATMRFDHDIDKFGVFKN